jgi:general secretion pathway protein K
MSGSDNCPKSGEAASSGQSGVALVLVIWLMALMSLVAMGFAGQMRTELLIARNQVEAARARGIADAGVSIALLVLTQSGPDVLWIPDGREYVLPYEDSQIRIRVQDEAGKVDLNAASDELIESLLLTLGVGSSEARRITDAIADWRDTDELRRASGAEAGEYAAERRSYGPANGPFLAIDELRLVLGVADELYTRIRPLVTVHSRNARVNSLTAPAEVIRSIPGITPDAAELFLAARASLEIPQPALLPALLGGERYLLRAATRMVTIRSEGVTSDGTTFVREAVAALTRTSGDQYRLMSWRRGEQELRSRLDH